MVNEFLAMEADDKKANHLLSERKEILSLPPDLSAKRILDSPQPAALIHSFSVEDFYFLIHDIGPEDAIEILSLASNRQWEFFLDMEPWEKDRLHYAAITRWIDLLMKADHRRFARWVLEEKNAFFELYLFKNIELKVREHDEDPSIFGEEYMTIDDVHYVRFLDYPFSSPLSAEDKKTRDDVLVRFLRILADYDFPRFQALLLESSSVIPAESEEDRYRLRNVRMAEKGFLPYEEAVGIYQPLKPNCFESGMNKPVSQRISESLLPIPVAFSRNLPEDNTFTRSLEVLQTDAVMNHLEIEFAALCNRIISADQKAVRDRQALRDIVKKACGYLSIGLERLNPPDGKPDIQQSAAMLVRHPLEDIFRLGFGAAQELKWRVGKWQKTAWFVRQNLPLTFWGEEGLGVLGGLLIQRPLCFDNYQTGVLYREFTSLNDVEQTQRAVDEIIAFDSLFPFLRISAVPFIHHPFFTYQNCLLTLWADIHLGLVDLHADPATPIPVPLDAFRPFFDKWWEGKKGGRRIRKKTKSIFLEWLGNRTALSKNDILQQVGSGLESLFSKIENEYGKVSARDIDPRYMHLFLIENPQDSQDGSNQE